MPTSFDQFMGNYGGLITGGIGLLGSYMSDRSASRQMGNIQQMQQQYAAPRSVVAGDIGTANYANNGAVYLNAGGMLGGFLNQNAGMANALSNQYQQQVLGQGNPVTTQNLQGIFNQSNNYQQDPGTSGVYNGFIQQGQNMMGQFNPGVFGQQLNSQDEANRYTNLLRQQAQPQEQQAASSLANQLFSSGRLGTTGGQGMFGQLMKAQQSADVDRQVAGQQLGLNNAIQAGQFNQQGQMSLANLAQQFQGYGANGLEQLNQTNYNRTQDRFQRNMTTFGAQNGLQQQMMQNSLGYQNQWMQGQGMLMNLANIGRGASVQMPGDAGIAAAAQRNTGNQNALAGLTGLASQYFSGAGGQAAGNAALGQGGGQLANGLMGLATGNYAGGAQQLGGLATNVSNSAAAAGMSTAGSDALGNIGTGLTALGSAYGVYNGIQQGGVGGYASAAANASNLYSSLGGTTNSAVGGALGSLAAAYGIYDGGKGVINAYENGDVMGGAVSGMEAGASIGSVVPGVGTVIGGVIGAAVGAIAGAIGDPPSHSELTYDGFKKVAGQNYMTQMSDYQVSEVFKGAWDTNNKGFGSKKFDGDRGKWLQGFADQITNGIKSGTISQSSTGSEIVSKVIRPWMTEYGTSKAASWLDPIMSDMASRLVSGQGIGKAVTGKKAQGMVTLGDIGQPAPQVPASNPSPSPTNPLNPTSYGFLPNDSISAQPMNITLPGYGNVTIPPIDISQLYHPVTYGSVTKQR